MTLILDILSVWSSIITLLLFIIYIIGRLWQIKRQQNLILEKYKFLEKISDDEASDLYPFIRCSERSNGQIFSVSSSSGIYKFRIYRAVLNESTGQALKGKLLFESKEVLQPDENLYIEADFYTWGSNVIVEFERMDYVYVQFQPADSGRDDSFVAFKYQTIMSWKSWLYYLMK